MSIHCMIHLSLHSSMHHPYHPYILHYNCHYTCSASSIASVHTSCVTSVTAPVCASSIPNIHASCITSVVAPVCALPILSVKPSNDECQEFLDKFPSTNYGEKNLSEITTKIPDDITLTYLRNYMLGVFQVVSCTMRSAHGSINQILLECNPGPTYLVQRLWDPGGPTYSSRSSVPAKKLPRLHPPTRTIIPTLPSCPKTKNS